MFLLCVLLLLAAYWFNSRRQSSSAALARPLPVRPPAVEPLTPFTFHAIERVEIPTHSALEFGREPFSFSFWFRTTTLYRPMTFMAKRVHTLADGWVVSMTERDSLLFYAAGCATAKGAAPNSRDGHWHHVAAVRHENLLTLYLDGAPVGIGEINCNCGDHHPIRIGMDAEPGGWHFAGELAEVHFYNRTLQAREVQEEWNGGTPRRNASPLPGLVAGYHLGDETEEIVDFTGKGPEGAWVKE